MPIQVGIEDISIYLPKIFYPIEDLAKLRDIDYAKLNRGLGLEKMSLCDNDENVATMGAEAVLELMRRREMNPKDISRIYLGTESSLDGSKPTASYILEMLEMVYGDGAFAHCDVVDMTFACIGAVDALENCLDYIRVHPEEKAIVVAADEALYEPFSSGEYTQGAGAVALLLQSNPTLLSIESKFATSTSSALDFFKPLRRLSTEFIINHSDAEELVQTDLNKRFFDVHTSTPVFDGQYSNWCYQKRIEEAFHRYCTINNKDATVLKSWKKLIFHLPYAYHAKRVCQPVFIDALIAEGRLDAFCKDHGLDMDLLSDNVNEFYKLLAKTEAYRAFVAEKLQDSSVASSQAGNLYTASIFLALASMLSKSLEADLTGETIAFFAYGSGSKSKVFTGRVEDGWRQSVSKMHLNEKLQKRRSISTEQYEQLRLGHLKEALSPDSRHFFVKENTATDYTKFATLFELRNSPLNEQKKQHKKAGMV